MVNLLEAFAEHKREQTSARTKDALAASKRRGVQLGKHGKEILSQENAIAAVEFAARLRPTIEHLQAVGFTTVRVIRDELNRQQIPTYRVGSKWYSPNVYAILKRIA